MMLEETIIFYLTGNNINAYAEVPKDPPDEFVIIERTGGGRVNMIDNARIAIQSYATSLYAAAQLDETVKNLMVDITALGSVCSCRLSASYNFTDPSTKRYRYQSIFDITYY